MSDNANSPRHAAPSEPAYAARSFQAALAYVLTNEPHDDVRAIHVCQLFASMPFATAKGREWCAHAAGHLEDRLERSLRDGPPKPRTEQQALALLRTMAQSLVRASDALRVAAEQLKAKGAAPQANHAYQAHLTAREAARGFID